LRELSRADLHLALDTCAEATGEREYIVVGAVSIVGPCAAPPPSLLTSADIDLFPRARESAAINAAIAARCGAGSEFEDEHGFYVEGVGRWTLLTALPDWETRLVRVDSPSGVVGWCLSALDLAVVKLDAARPKDLHYVAEMLRASLVSPGEILTATAACAPWFHEKITRKLRALEG
jgi:hypothetical protein